MPNQVRLMPDMSTRNEQGGDTPIAMGVRKRDRPKQVTEADLRCRVDTKGDGGARNERGLSGRATVKAGWELC